MNTLSAPFSFPTKDIEDFFPVPVSQPAHEKIVPGFGERAGTSDKGSTWQEKALFIATCVGPIFAGIALGALAHPVLSIFGGLLGGAAALGGFVAASFFQHTFKYQFQRILPPTSDNKRSDATLPLGKYIPSDIRVCDTADRSLQWKIDLIAAAEQSIELSPNFAGGPYFHKALQAIEKRMGEREAVTTHVVLSSDNLTEEDTSRLNALKKKYGPRFSFLISPRILHMFPIPHTEENHVKLLIVDGRYFVVGGTGIHHKLCQETMPLHQPFFSTNLASRVLPYGVRDCDVIGKSDDLGKVLRKQFFRLYQIWEMRSKNSAAESRFFPINDEKKGTSSQFDFDDGQLIKNAKTKALVSGPEHNGSANPITKEYVKRITKAKKSIDIANFMLDLPNPIQEALQRVKATNQEVSITGYTCGQKYLPYHLIPITTMRSRKAYSAFHKVYEYDTQDQWYHKKTALFDNKHFMCGSYNHGGKSANYDHEIALVVKSEAVADIYKKTLEEDTSRSTEHIEQHNPLKIIISHIASAIFGQFC